MKVSNHDERFMRRALALAKRGLGQTSPNPVVGAVLVRNGCVVSQGWHKRAGGPHAEVFALENAGVRSQKSGARSRHGRTLHAPRSTLYVTLEPCCSWGKTPPCTDAIMAAGVKRVVVAALDPNPKHNGRGLKILRRAGIRVEHGLLADEATAMNEAFNKWITTGLPFVIAKAGMSLDGKIATRTGDSKWITGKAARREAHKLRAGVDAIMVGANTVIHDNPQLTVRHGVRSKQPLGVVVDSRGKCPLTARIFRDKFRSRTIVLTTAKSSLRWRRCLVLRGIEVVTVVQRDGHVNLRAGLRALGKRNVTNVLVEGGGELLGSLFDARLVDKVVFFYAPIILGGRKAVTAVAGKGVANVKGAPRLRACRWRQLGDGEMICEAGVAR